MELTIYDHSQGMLTEHQTALAEELLAQAAAKLALPASAELSLTLVRNPEMKELNAKYRGVDRATDVISFAINDEEDLTLPAELQAELPLDLGDLFISLDKVKEQHASADIFFRNRNDQTQIGRNQLAFCFFIAFLDSSGDFRFLGRIKQLHPPDFFQIHLDRVIDLGMRRIGK